MSRNSGTAAEIVSDDAVPLTDLSVFSPLARKASPVLSLLILNLFPCLSASFENSPLKTLIVIADALRVCPEITSLFATLFLKLPSGFSLIIS